MATQEFIFEKFTDKYWRCTCSNLSNYKKYRNKIDKIDQDIYALIQKRASHAVAVGKIKSKISPLTFIPIIFTSVINKKRIHKIIEISLDVYNNRNQKISTSKLNNILLPEIEKTPPPATKGKYIKIKLIK